MSDLINGLKHMADDHPCCKETIYMAINELVTTKQELDEAVRLLGYEIKRSYWYPKEETIVTKQIDQFIESVNKEENTDK